jgi:FtsP/CotA-like multicopper oxidase with cupredoxin domain
MLSRRALLAGGVSSLAAPAILARAQNSTDSAATAPTILRLERRDIEVNGKTASIYAIRQPNGTFGITTEVGKSFRVRVENGIDEPSLIHWHGLTPPWRQDGVPGISGPPIPAGGSADYDFPLSFGGTFWMHSHQGLQEQGLMAAPLIIHDERDRADEQEGRGDAGRFQLHAGRTDLRKSEELELDGGHGQTGRRHGFEVEHDNGGADGDRPIGPRPQ